MSRLRSNNPCWCGSAKKYKRCHGDRRALRRPAVELHDVSPPRNVPDHIERPDYVTTGAVGTPTGVQIHRGDEIERLRHAGSVAARVLERTAAAVAPGITTEQLDEIAHDTYIELGAYPSTLHYKAFTKSICTSVNGVICHGIPDARPLADGDIVNVDVTAYVDGMHGDTSATLVAGRTNDATLALIETTREATERGIAAVAPGEPLRVIADAIEPFAHSRGFDVVNEYGGHGIGRTFHSAPHINHHRTPGRSSDDTTRFEVGMTFTIEPMLISGGASFTLAPDGWTEHIDDDMVSAQFEHTIIVTDDGAEILTLTPTGTTAVNPA